MGERGGSLCSYSWEIVSLTGTWNCKLSCRKLLYPPPASTSGNEKPVPNTYHPFRLLDKKLEHGLKDMVQEEQARFSGEPASMNGQLS